MFTPLTIFFGIVALGLLIFVHETGHFLVAKAFGVRVITYSFGFGHRLLGFRHKGTDYRLSAIPFGRQRWSGRVPATPIRPRTSGACVCV